MQAVIPDMRARTKGSIVNVNSGTAFVTIPGYSVYSASKRALLGFSLTARMELEKDGIVVREVYPYLTATNFGKNRRTDLLEKRRSLMDAWAAHCEPRDGSNVLEFRKSGGSTA
jgi:short-subunit dehydrogenase